MFNIISPIAVLLASVAAYLFGWLWYSEVLFGKTWMRILGKTKKNSAEAKSEMTRVMAYGFLVTVVTAYGIAVFLALLDPKSILEALQIGILLCFSFVVTTKFTELIYESNEPHWSQKPQELFFIGAGYQVGSFILMTAVIWYVSYAGIIPGVF
jgi:phosphatidylglycerophosphate synthase